MGKTVEKKRKKKKGRPSLLDLQKRSLRQQQEQLQPKQLNNLKKNPKISNPNPSPNSSYPSTIRRSTRRNPNPNPEDDDDEDRSSGKRREKKLNLVLKLPNRSDELHSGQDNSGSDSSRDDKGFSESGLRKRKIDSISPGSGLDDDVKGENQKNKTSTQQGSKLDDGPSMPLPDKKLLFFILDRLQKKDTYGVFAEPVDPKELPDYHEVIEHPMDFSTVRKKLSDGAYANMEQFEKDVYLICSNAMQYNAPETIYFRQARSIQDLARRDFENLRQDSDDNEAEPEPKVVRRGRPPTKNLKKPPGRPPLERANSNFSEATLATSGGNNNKSNNDQRKGPSLSEKFSTDSFPRSLSGPRLGEAYIGWSAERYERSDDMTGSASRGLLTKHGKKIIVLDESRRNTYKQTHALASRHEPSVLTTFSGERKQLIAVGLHTELGYARSLSRFAAKLGPVAWKVASRKIERCLPASIKFGPGWVGESEAPAERLMPQQLPADQLSSPQSSSVCRDSSSTPTRGIVESSSDTLGQKPQLGEQSSERQTPSCHLKLDDESSKASSPIIHSNGAGPNLSTIQVSPSSNPNTAPNVLNRSSTGAMKVGHPFQMHQSSNLQPSMNRLNGSYGRNFAAQMGKIIGGARPTVSTTETHSLHQPSGDDNGGEVRVSGIYSSIKPNGAPHQKVGPAPPDLNVGFQTPGSPGSRRADTVQPDLALQL